jgi:hypothetical protein
MSVFWLFHNLVSFKVVQSFRRSYCLRHQRMEAVSTSETSSSFCQNRRGDIPEHNHIHNRNHENLKFNINGQSPKMHSHVHNKVFCNGTDITCRYVSILRHILTDVCCVLKSYCVLSSIKEINCQTDLKYLLEKQRTSLFTRKVPPSSDLNTASHSRPFSLVSCKNSWNSLLMP